jgi:F-type H+-transporting ATPase subunit epsilon
MAETLQLELVSPERLLVSAAVEMVVVPGTEGDFGVLPRHSDLLSTVRPGIVSVYADRNGQPSERFFVSGGFAEVSRTGCTVLVDEALPVSDITAAYVADRLAKAKTLTDSASSDEERRRAAAAQVVADAIARVAGNA